MGGGGGGGGGGVRPGRVTTRLGGWPNPAISRSSVVFPQPDGPSSVTNSPAPKLSVVGWTAARDPNSLATASSTRKRSSRASLALSPAASPRLSPACTLPSCRTGFRPGLSRVDIVIRSRGCGITDRQHGVDPPCPAPAGAPLRAHHRERPAHQHDRAQPDEHPDHVEGGRQLRVDKREKPNGHRRGAPDPEPRHTQ